MHRNWFDLVRDHQLATRAALQSWAFEPFPGDALSNADKFNKSHCAAFDDAVLDFWYYEYLCA
jgi:hypothetical protein